MPNVRTALVVVDMQNYYLDPTSDFCRFSCRENSTAMDYIRQRAEATVIPNIIKLLSEFRRLALPVIFLRLCGNQPDRSDLHPFFRQTYEKGTRHGLLNVYPLADSPAADIITPLKPLDGEPVFAKTTFSGLNSGGFSKFLLSSNLQNLVFTGLATSQCVDTTARDASDAGFGVFHIEDAQADYDESFHMAALFASQGVCGGKVFSTSEFLRFLRTSIQLTSGSA